MLLYRVYHICGQMLKNYLYSPIIYYIALFQTLKRNYAVNVTKMYYAYVLFYLCKLCVTTYRHKQSQRYQVLPTVKVCITKCHGVSGASPGFGMGGGKNFFFQIWKYATCCACSPEKIFLNEAIWCVLVYILIRFCL